MLAFSHFERDLRSLFTYMLISFIVHLMVEKQVSTAKSKVDELHIAKLRSLIKIKKARVLRQVLVVHNILISMTRVNAIN